MTKVMILAPVLISMGCGAGALETHTKALGAMRTTLDVAATTIETACAERARAVVGTDQAHQLVERCERASALHGATRVAWQGWLDSVMLAASEDKPDLSEALGLAIEVARLYARISSAFDLPPIPSWLSKLIAEE